MKSGWIKSPNCTRLHTGLCRPVVRSGPASHDNAKGALCYCDILVTDGFVLTEMAAVSDALRITNRVNATPLFSWTFRSAQGGPVASPSGATVMTEPFSDKARPEYVFAIGNAAANAPALSMGPTIRRYVHSGAQVFLMAEAASRHLKERGGDQWRDRGCQPQARGGYNAESYRRSDSHRRPGQDTWYFQQVT
jgi:hypothetical protein